MTGASRYEFSQMLPGLWDATEPCCYAFLGGGGKTSLIERCGRELATFFPRVLLTSLTRSGTRRAGETLLLNEKKLDRIPQCYVPGAPLRVMRSRLNEEKFEGVTVDELKALAGEADVCLVECDGAANLPLKAHDERDPVVPPFADAVVMVVGADAVGATLSSGRVHRPERFAQQWGVSPQQPLETGLIAEVLLSPEGYGRKVPEGVEIVYYVNKADLDREAAQSLAGEIHARTGGGVWYGSLEEGYCREVE